MKRYVKTIMIFMLVLSLLSGCSLFNNDKYIILEEKAHKSSEDNYYKEDRPYLKNKYLQERFSIADGEYIIENIFAIKNDYLYYITRKEASDGSLNGDFSIYRHAMTSGNGEKLVTVDKEYIICNMAVDDEGNIYLAVKDKADADEVSVANYSLNKYDASGSLIYSNDITDDLVYDGGQSQSVGFSSKFGYYRSNYDINAVYIGNDGYLYAGTGLGLAIYDCESGKLKRWLIYGGGITGIINARNNHKYMLGSHDLDGYPHGFRYVQELESNGTIESEKIVHDSDIDVGIFRNTYSSGLNYDFLAMDYDYLYACDLQKLTLTRILRFVNEGIGGNVKYSAELSDGRIVILEFVGDYNDKRMDAVILTPAEEDGKKTLRLGTDYVDSNLKETVCSFNKNNTEYRIQVGLYEDYSNTLEMGDLDIFAIDGYSYKCRDLVDKGVIEDIGHYLDASDKLSREDFLEQVVTSHTYDGVLVGIPLGIKGYIIGDASTIIKENLTPEELESEFEANPRWQLETCAQEVTGILMANNFEHISDPKTYKFELESELLKEYLEYAKSFPMPKRERPKKITDVGSFAYAFTENTALDYKYELGDSLPTYCISADSKYKDAAWILVEDILCLNTVDTYGGMYTRKNLFDAAIDNEDTVLYDFDRYDNPDELYMEYKNFWNKAEYRRYNESFMCLFGVYSGEWDINDYDTEWTLILFDYINKGHTLWKDM